ncbi:hypothetical protein TrVE_jg13911 [Triparma verrucosa]|uniref:Transmembrane protein n=1 Tax=Triparma verrucosa TaxID=1606542 RepID=A0A9W7B7T7_9STRA|nr:hypothetical protein TrVE_jg13911 [Triparma verrucosa]
MESVPNPIPHRQAQQQPSSIAEGQDANQPRGEVESSKSNTTYRICHVFYARLALFLQATAFLLALCCVFLLALAELNPYNEDITTQFNCTCKEMKETCKDEVDKKEENGMGDPEVAIFPPFGDDFDDKLAQVTIVSKPTDFFMLMLDSAEPLLLVCSIFIVLRNPRASRLGLLEWTSSFFLFAYYILTAVIHILSSGNVTSNVISNGIYTAGMLMCYALVLVPLRTRLRLFQDDELNRYTVGVLPLTALSVFASVLFVFSEASGCLLEKYFSEEAGDNLILLCENKVVSSRIFGVVLVAVLLLTRVGVVPFFPESYTANTFVRLNLKFVELISLLLGLGAYYVSIRLYGESRELFNCEYKFRWEKEKDPFGSSGKSVHGPTSFA